ncbi:MAG TPA: alcohol dehydrogenase catalytic domain-containing protein [Anaerovoracaceae bacterium]|nr:alcohol dehydrogenase catalytic domain-containing protein [Anaerovoracaceae bacterium]
MRVKIKYTGICGTDLHILSDEYPANYPVVLGHEYSGVIDAVGFGVRDFALGDRVVSLTAAVVCGKCRYCYEGLHMLCDSRRSIGSGIDGAMAEYMTVPADLLFPVPENVSMKTAVLSEPLACCVRSVVEVSAVRPGDFVYISGPGTIGQIVAQLAKIAGAHVTVAGVGVDADRLALAKRLSADEVIDLTAENAMDAARRITGGDMFDVVYECAGAQPSATTCLDVVRKRGQFVQVGLYGKPIQFDMDKALVEEVFMVNSRATERTSWVTSLRLLAQGRLDLEPLVSNVFRLEEWEKAMAAAQNKEGFKILFEIG